MQQQRLRPLRSTGTDERSTGTDERLKSTLADLDALLGIKEEEQQEEAKVGVLCNSYIPHVITPAWCWESVSSSSSSSMCFARGRRAISV
jgi:hypothetical protein